MNLHGLPLPVETPDDDLLRPADLEGHLGEAETALLGLHHAALVVRCEPLSKPAVGSDVKVLLLVALGIHANGSLPIQVRSKMVDTLLVIDLKLPQQREDLLTARRRITEQGAAHAVSPSMNRPRVATTWIFSIR